MKFDLMTEIYSSFDPFNPPPKEAYVDCEAVRGRWDIKRELGKKITRSNKPTCQLYSGYTGVGKSTELLQLKEWLEAQNFFVVYFAADDKDIEPQDTEYADILFACTRQLVQQIRLQTNNPLTRWVGDRWESLKDLALSEVVFEGLDLEAKITELASITANLRAVPDKRRALRQRINDSTPSLVNALNEFIEEALRSSLKHHRGLVIMVDNLDRIVEKKDENLPSNWDEIYLNRSEVLRGLKCHVIYTVPIQMVYSERATRLEDYYDKPDVLPMISVRNPSGKLNREGVLKLREMIRQRIALVDANLAANLETQFFQDEVTLNKLCGMSGGHVRILMQMIQRSLDWIDDLPITAEAVQIAIEITRDTYRDAIRADQWETLAAISDCKQSDNSESHLRLLLNRCLLEYRYYDDQNRLQRWCDVHPLIKDIEPFQQALKKIRAAMPPTP